MYLISISKGKETKQIDIAVTLYTCEVSGSNLGRDFHMCLMSRRMLEFYMETGHNYTFSFSILICLTIYGTLSIRFVGQLHV
jgi:hypothetical protein